MLGDIIQSALVSRVGWEVCRAGGQEVRGQKRWSWDPVGTVKDPRELTPCVPEMGLIVLKNC